MRFDSGILGQAAEGHCRTAGPLLQAKKSALQEAASGYRLLRYPADVNLCLLTFGTG